MRWCLLFTFLEIANFRVKSLETENLYSILERDAKNKRKIQNKKQIGMFKKKKKGQNVNEMHYEIVEFWFNLQNFHQRRYSNLQESWPVTKLKWDASENIKRILYMLNFQLLPKYTWFNQVLGLLMYQCVGAFLAEYCM